jgi:multidrug efflux pump
VYAPLAFATGRTGRLFIEFALTLAGSVLVSGFVALTLSPMMCSQILKHQATHSPLYNAIERFFVGMTNLYRRALTAVLGHRLYVALVWVIALGAGALLFLNLKQELAPYEDRGVVIGVVSAPEGATLGYTVGYMKQIEDFYAKVPERERYFTVAGYPTVADGISFLNLKTWENRQRKQQEISKELFPKFFGLPGVMAFPINPASLGQGFGRPVNFIIMTQAPYEELQRITQRLIAEAANNPGMNNIDTDLKLNKPELKVNVNRDKLADVGIPVENVSRTLETMLGGRQVTRFKKDGEQYDVIVKVADVDRSNPDDITAIYTRARDGGMVELSNFVSVRESVSPKSLNHFNKLRAASITANLAPNYTLGEALEFMAKAADKVLPPTAQTDMDGQSREFRDSSSSIYLTLVLALAFIYLVLAAQFESFVDPFIIMLTVPLAFTGALATLWLTGGTLSIYSKIGLITLVGLITKHGILIVEFANQLQGEGKPMLEAVTEAAVLRLRPILMTTGAMVLGAVPLALAVGAGAESRVQIGWVIVGGMVFGTCLTLFVVPAAYTLVARKRMSAEEEASAPRHTIAQAEGAE